MKDFLTNLIYLLHHLKYTNNILALIQDYYKFRKFDKNYYFEKRISTWLLIFSNNY